MLFNSLDFALFLPIVFVLYWFVFNQNLKTQNLFILLASYLFYAWWDWRFLFLIILSTVLDYSIGLLLSNEQNKIKRKFLLGISLVINLGLLGVFKYYNFFIDNFIRAFSFFGLEMNSTSLEIILPVGISFYTFQTLSYSIDVYRYKLKPTNNFISFAAFVSFFPQLVAGPIERAKNLLPQFCQERIFSHKNAVEGLRQILWGLVKKIVIADNCAVLVNQIFENPDTYNGSSLALGAILFAFQIYGDFSGYSDIAIGTSNLLGFSLMKNFSYPYFSRDIAEFWRKWHISLSTWFRDYLYIPLGGSKGARLNVIRNTFLIFVISGFWHGANWTFIIWGLLNAIYFLPLLLTKNNRKNIGPIAQGRKLPTLRDTLKILWTFSLTTLAWVFFRSETINESIAYISGIFSRSLFAFPNNLSFEKVILLSSIIFIFLTIEWIGRDKDYGLQTIQAVSKKWARWIIYLSIILIIYVFGMYEQTTDFIYFQF